MKKQFFLFVWLIMSWSFLHAQRLDRFVMSKFAAGGKSGVAYPMQKSFFGKLPSDSIHFYVKNDTTFYNVHIWLPKPVKELGVQLISPVPQFALACKGDYEAPGYHDSLKADGKYFDPVLTVTFVPIAKFSENNDTIHCKPTFKIVGKNDNSSEAPPTLIKKNSLLRIGQTETDTAYAAAGLYTVTFTSVANKKPEGTFVVQVGVTEPVPGLKFFRQLDELTEANK